MPDLSEEFLYSKQNLNKQKTDLEVLKISNSEQKDKKEKSNKDTK